MRLKDAAITAPTPRNSELYAVQDKRYFENLWKGIYNGSMKKSLATRSSYPLTAFRIIAQKTKKDTKWIPNKNGKNKL